MCNNYKGGAEKSAPPMLLFGSAEIRQPGGYVPRLSNNLITAAAAKNEDYSKDNNPGAVIIEKMA